MGTKCQTPGASMAVAPGQVTYGYALCKARCISHGKGFISTSPAYFLSCIFRSSYRVDSGKERSAPCHGTHPVFIRGEQNQPWIMGEISTVPVFSISKYQISNTCFLDS